MLTTIFPILQPQYGHLKACIKHESGKSLCVVQFFHQLDSVDDRNCPLIRLSNVFMTVESVSILTAISVVHRCNKRCELKVTRKRFHVEREQCTLNSLTLAHNFSNDMFIVNIYCMKSI